MISFALEVFDLFLACVGDIVKETRLARQHTASHLLCASVTSIASVLNGADGEGKPLLNTMRNNEPKARAEPLIKQFFTKGNIQMTIHSRIIANITKRRLPLGVAVSVAILLGAVVYAATPTLLGVGTVAHSNIIGGPATMTARKLTIPPKEVGGWHYHPGLITAVITKGTVIVEDGCGQMETFNARDAFEKNDGRVHRAINPSDVEEEEYNMFIMPQGNPITVNIPDNQRLCGPALNEDECKDGGWMNFTFPHAFNNEGECVSFVKAHN